MIRTKLIWIIKQADFKHEEFYALDVAVMKRQRDYFNCLRDVIADVAVMIVS